MLGISYCLVEAHLRDKGGICYNCRCLEVSLLFVEAYSLFFGEESFSELVLFLSFPISPATLVHKFPAHQLSNIFLFDFSLAHQQQGLPPLGL